MILLADWSLKVTLIFVAAFLLAWMLRRTSAAVRHMIWAAATFAAIVLPVFTFYVPAWETDLPMLGAPGVGFSITMMEVRASPSTPGMSIVDLMFLTWALVSIAGLLRLLFGMWRLSRLASRSQRFTRSAWLEVAGELSRKLNLRRSVLFLQNNDESMLVTWGLFRLRILLPPGAEHWPAERIRVVLTHEFAHIHRYDWCVQIAAELVRAIYWFNPLAWVARERIRMESENACDDVVLRSGIDAPDYAAHLLVLARQLKNAIPAGLSALAMVRQSNLERRFLAMLNPSLNRGAVTRATVILTVLGALLLTLPLSALQAPAQGFPARLTGNIFDQSGAALPGASVVIANPTARTRDETTADAVGVFEFPQLPAGQYDLEVNVPGFRRYQQRNLTLQQGGGARLNVTLEVGTVSDEVVVSAKAPPRAAAPLAGGPPTRIRVGGNVQVTRLLRQLKPIYPDTLRDAGIQGRVLLEGVIGIDGTLMSLRLLNTAVDRQLAEAAIEAVKQWRYSPTLLNGVPVEVLTNVAVDFRLEE